MAASPCTEDMAMDRVITLHMGIPSAAVTYILRPECDSWEEFIIGTRRALGIPASVSKHDITLHNKAAHRQVLDTADVRDGDVLRVPPGQVRPDFERRRLRTISASSPCTIVCVSQCHGQ